MATVVYAPDLTSCTVTFPLNETATLRQAIATYGEIWLADVITNHLRDRKEIFSASSGQKARDIIQTIPQTDLEAAIETIPSLTVPKKNALKQALSEWKQ